MGGAVHTAAQTQEKAMPVMASLVSNRVLPKGLQTTSHLSQEMMARDQRPVMPAGESQQTTALSLPHHFFHPNLLTVLHMKRHLPRQLPAKPHSPECFQVQGALNLLVHFFF